MTRVGGSRTTRPRCGSRRREQPRQYQNSRRQVLSSGGDVLSIKDNNFDEAYRNFASSMEVSQRVNELAVENVRRRNGVYAGVVDSGSGKIEESSRECESESAVRERRGAGECRLFSRDGSEHNKLGRLVHDSSIDTVGRTFVQISPTPGWRNSSGTHLRQYEGGRAERSP